MLGIPSGPSPPLSSRSLTALTISLLLILKGGGEELLFKLVSSVNGSLLFLNTEEKYLANKLTESSIVLEFKLPKFISLGIEFKWSVFLRKENSAEGSEQQLFSN